MKELKEMMKNTSGEEAKALLFQFFLRLKMVEEGSYPEEQFMKDMKKTYQDFVYDKKQAKQEEHLKVTHIVFGDSAAGSLKMALRDLKIEMEENVISFSDHFSIGPVWKLHEKEGILHRFQWLKNHINFEGEEADEIQNRFLQSLHEIESIPPSIPIVIWVGDNSHEQTGLRYVLYLLNKMPNKMIVINTNQSYQDEFQTSDVTYMVLHTGELAHDHLKGIYKHNHFLPLTREQRKVLEDEWEQLSNHQELLRIWENDILKNVDEDYYDSYIIQTAQRLQQQRKSMKFMKSARLIGELIGFLDQYIGDQFFEYRIKTLIMQGVFEIQGVPKAMRFYSVRLRES